MEESLIREALSRPSAAIAYSVSQELARRYPERFLLEGDEGTFDPWAYAVSEQCTLERRAGAHSQTLTSWHRSCPASTTGNGWYEVTWNGQHLDVIRMSWQQGFCMTSQLREVAELADGFSFAYLKELVLSSMVRWIGDPAPGEMYCTMVSQAAQLREQMGTMHEVVPLMAGADDGDDEIPGVE